MDTSLESTHLIVKYFYFNNRQITFDLYSQVRTFFWRSLRQYFYLTILDLIIQSNILQTIFQKQILFNNGMIETKDSQD